MIKVWGDSQSGNCYKVQLLLAQLGIEHDWQHVDILAGDTHTPSFLALNSNGKIPLVQLPDGSTLAESNAILWYFSDGTLLRPRGARLEAELLQWMFFEQYSHEPFIATSRYLIKYLGGGPEHRQALATRQPKGYKALDVMEQHLSQHIFFVNNEYSIADIALYAYTHVAHEGGFQLQHYPHIRRWLERVATQPLHRVMG